jgi:hypothetical protein
MDVTVMPLIVHREEKEPDKVIVVGKGTFETAKAAPIPDEPKEAEAPKPKRGRPPKIEETE